MKIGQSKKHSMIESSVNILIGYTTSVLMQMFLFPLFGIKVALQDNFIICGIFTIITLARSYALRRFFNWMHTR